MLELNEGGKEMSACKAKRAEIRVEAGMTRKKNIFLEKPLSLGTFQNKGDGCGCSLKWRPLVGTHQLLIPPECLQVM